MGNVLNAHIYPSLMTHESRIYKQAVSLRKLDKFDQIWLIGILGDGLPKEETYSDKIIIKRINTNLFGNYTGNGLLTYAVFYMKVFWLLLFQKLKMVNIHNLELLPMGAALKFFKRSLLIYDPHELETEKTYCGNFRRRVLRKIERTLIKYSDKVFVVGEAIAEHYVQNYCCEKPTVLLNCPGLKEVSSRDYFREKFNIPSDSIIFVSQGCLEEHRGIEIIIDAFSKINDISKCVVFMGDGELIARVEEASNKRWNIFYHPPVHPDDVLNYTSSGNVGLALIEDVSLSYHYCMPNKIFEYLMSGLPVVVSDLPEMKKVVESTKVGVVLKQYTSEALYELIMEYDFNQINRADIKTATLQYYNWNSQEEIMLAEYNKISLL